MGLCVGRDLPRAIGEAIERWIDRYENSPRYAETRGSREMRGGARRNRTADLLNAILVDNLFCGCSDLPRIGSIRANQGVSVAGRVLGMPLVGFSGADTVPILLQRHGHGDDAAHKEGGGRAGAV